MKGRGKRKLLFSVTKKDFDIEYFSGTGAGGQHRNKHQNCVRMKHPESGATATGQSSKSREANQREAFKNIINHSDFKMWHNRRVQEELTGVKLKDKVRDMMREENLHIECFTPEK